MGARGFNIAQEGHVVPLLSPANITGGAASQILTLRDAAKCNIILQVGAESAATGNVQLFASTDSTGATSQAIGFDLFTQAALGAGDDVFGARQPIAAAGFVPAASTVHCIHVQADQLPQGYSWLQLRIADGTDTDFASAVAILTGVRFQGESNQTATL